jgi:hypothetical protein
VNRGQKQFTEEKEMEDSTILGTAVWISRQKNLDKRRELVGDEAE